MQIEANNPDLKSWVHVSPDSDFPIQNIPFGIAIPPGRTPRVCTIIGDKVVDLLEAYDLGLFDGVGVQRSVFKNRYINELMALGKEKTREIRQRISELLRVEDPHHAELHSGRILVSVSQCKMMMPVKVGDYTDFYSSEEHATNVGTMFRDPENALLPNWKHLPVGYHGRASSIVVSGTPIHRPMGQTIPPDSQQPVFGPSKLLDFELEMAFVVGKETRLGQRISTEEAEDYIFGLVLFNDWSARDIQKWEYVPLGPFLAKSFASTVSPWVVTLDALEPFRTVGPDQDPKVLPYLQYSGKKNYDLNLEVAIQTENGDEKVVCNSNSKYLYWNMAQQLAHHTVNGCNFKIGDMCASGTISGKTPESFGSMLEISWKGTKPIQMPDGTSRKFINDGDKVVLRGHGRKGKLRIGFGEAAGKILPSNPFK
ncbi:MAG: fumarylacetoacetase [Saprospirales bacterium]|nr:MAG: fumarylacetoacetase [Saprospirales bacterium]